MITKIKIKLREFFFPVVVMVYLKYHGWIWKFKALHIFPRIESLTEPMEILNQCSKIPITKIKVVQFLPKTWYKPNINITKTHFLEKNRSGTRFNLEKDIFPWKNIFIFWFMLITISKERKHFGMWKRRSEELKRNFFLSHRASCKSVSWNFSFLILFLFYFYLLFRAHKP